MSRYSRCCCSSGAGYGGGFGAGFGGGFGRSSNCICDFPTLIILILIVLQFSRKESKKCCEGYDD